MKIDIAKASMEEKNVVSCPTRLSSREQRNLAKLCARKDVHIVAACGIFENDNKYKDEDKFLKKRTTEKKTLAEENNMFRLELFTPPSFLLFKTFLSLWRQS